jgi:serine/threonine protein kinase
VWKIADFGMTMEGSSKRPKTTKLSRGTASYRAPELFSSSPTFTQSVDMWAVGCILFELITGREAFDGDWGTLQFVQSNGKLAIPRFPFANNINFFLLDIIRNLLNIDASKRLAAPVLLERLAHSPSQPVTESDKTYVLGGDPELRFIRVIGMGGFGEVCEVCLSSLIAALIHSVAKYVYW